MFWITFWSWSYNPNFNFWNIDYLTYWLLPWDILLIVMTILVILSILWLWKDYYSDYSDYNDKYQSDKRMQKHLEIINQKK